MKWFRAIAALAMLACLSPVAALTYVAYMANRYGCTVHEGFVNPCIVEGVDIGARLYALGMTGWLLLATLPVFVAVAALWIVVEVARWVAARRRASSLPPPPQT
jgi:hypothetical protein